MEPQPVVGFVRQLGEPVVRLMISADDPRLLVVRDGKLLTRKFPIPLCHMY